MEPEPESPTKHQRQIRNKEMVLMKQQILDIRRRKMAIPSVNQPTIVKNFEELTKVKNNHNKKEKIIKSLAEKKKEQSTLKAELEKYKQKYDAKGQSFRERTHLLKVLNSRLQMEYQKTKEAFLDVEIHRAILTGLRKLHYYRLAEIVFSNKARTLFNVEEMLKRSQEVQSSEENGISLGYVGLLIQTVGEISESRLWFDFVFKGSKSTIRLRDGTIVILRTNQLRIKEGLQILFEQLYQIMTIDMEVKVQKTKNIYNLLEELSKVLVS